MSTRLARLSLNGFARPKHAKPATISLHKNHDYSPSWFVAPPTKRLGRLAGKLRARGRENRSAYQHPRVRVYRPAPGQAPFGLERRM
jgi:hypothetical protein